MAQAPDAPGATGAPRQNKTVKQFSGMNTQNERNAIPEGSFHWLENIQPIGPGNLHSIPGRGQSLTRIPPNPVPPPGCTDTTERGQQLITIETAFDQASTFGAGNLRTSWAQVVNGELYSLVGQASCAGGNMAYTNVCCQINHYKDDNPALFESILLPTTDPFAAFVNARIGTADRPVWAAADNGFGGLRVYYDLGNSFVDYHTPSTNFGGHNCDNFAIMADEVWIWIPGNLDGGPPFVEFAVFDRLNGAVRTNDFFSFGNDAMSVTNMQLTADFLYCVGTLAGVTKIYKIDRTNGIIAASFDITQINGDFIAVANDNLIYLVCAGNPAAVYYLKNFADLVYVGKTVGQGFTGFAFGTGIWNNGKLYYGSNGFGGFTTDVFKIAIDCPAEASPPTAPLIAEITRADNVVPAGNPVIVDWTDILVPDSTDRIELRPAPAAGDLGFVGAPVATMATGALANGSVSFTIPALTTPGDYIFQLTTNFGAGSILIATSAQFTVT